VPCYSYNKDAWAAAALYLDGRIQSRDDEKPGRQPDMSEEAGKAVRAVLQEASGTQLYNHAGLHPFNNGFNQHMWAALEQLRASNGPAGAYADGAAAGFSQPAREEAAGNIIGNHANLLKDICNPSPTDNIIGIPLTQTHLKRVPYQHAIYVDELLRGRSPPAGTAPRLRGARGAVLLIQQGRVGGGGAVPGRPHADLGQREARSQARLWRGGWQGGTCGAARGVWHAASQPQRTPLSAAFHVLSDPRRGKRAEAISTSTTHQHERASGTRARHVWGWCWRGMGRRADARSLTAGSVAE